MTIPTTEMTIGDRALQWAAVNGRHGDGVNTMCVLQRMRWYGVKFISTHQLDIELALVIILAIISVVTKLDPFRRVLLIK